MVGPQGNINFMCVCVSVCVCAYHTLALFYLPVVYLKG